MSATTSSRHFGDWRDTAVVYQVYPRSFADSNGDGIGDIPGIIAHLDHISNLGVDVVWLSPVYPSPGADGGYDISDYRGIDPVLGTLADFDRLVADLHRRDLRLVMDLVVNHTSDQHPWFLDSRRGGEDRADWYIWRDGGVGGTPPNNWVSHFGGPAWTFDPVRGQYYLHLFAPGQPDLNWENPEVRAAVHAVMNWWLDRGVDGFRMDVINFIAKDHGLPSSTVSDGHTMAGSEFYASRPRLEQYLAEMNERVFASRPGTFTVGEMPGVTVEQARQFTRLGRGLDMVFQFEHMSLDYGRDKWDPRAYSVRELKAVLGRWQEGLAESSWNSLYLSNHDQPRQVSRFGNDGELRWSSATALATVMHLQRGTPFVYQGEELGLPNAQFDAIEDYRDIETITHYASEQTPAARAALMFGIRHASRDNARTPMPWTDADNSGFTTGTPWIRVPDHHRPLNAKAQKSDDSSVFAYYRRLIRLRHEEPLVASGGYRDLLPEHPQLYAFARESGDAALVVIANLGDRDAVLAVGELVSTHAEHVLSNAADPRVGDQWMLGPWEVHVFRHEGSFVKYAESNQDEGGQR